MKNGHKNGKAPVKVLVADDTPEGWKQGALVHLIQQVRTLKRDMTSGEFLQQLERQKRCHEMLAMLMEKGAVAHVEYFLQAALGEEGLRLDDC
jgi:hypothetical protein